MKQWVVWGSILFALEAAAADIPPASSSAPENPKEKKHYSLMYDEKELKWIHEAIRAYDLHIPLDILLPGVISSDDIVKKSLSNAKGLQKPLSTMDGKDKAPSISLSDDMVFIYVNSIVYTDDTHWAIWLDNKKFIPGDTDPLWEIVEVTAEHVVIRWRNFPMEKLVPSWKNNFIPLKNPLVLTNGENILLHTEAKTLVVLLKPHQTFAGSVLEVMESKMTSKSLPVIAPLTGTSIPSAADETQRAVTDTAIDPIARALYKADRYHVQLDRLVRFTE